MPRRGSTKKRSTESAQPEVRNADGIFTWLLFAGVAASITAITLVLLELDQLYSWTIF